MSEVTISDQGYYWVVKIIDSTHASMKLANTTSTCNPWIYHFNQMPDWAIEELRKQGLINGRFFYIPTTKAFDDMAASYNSDDIPF